MKAIVNGHTFEKISDSFNFGDGLFIPLPPCYVVDGETVPEEFYYRELKAQIANTVRAALDASDER